MDELDKLFDFSREPEQKPELAPSQTKNKAVEPSSTPSYIAPSNGDMLVELPILLLDDFATGMEKQPFRPYSAEQMEEMVEDVRQNGILQPLLVRKKQDGRYEIVSGHNRRTAAASIGYKVIPCIIRQMSNDSAIKQMISTNLNQRDKLLPSEKAWAYRYLLEAAKRQGKRTDLTSCQLGTKFRTDEEIARNSEESARQIMRYIRLTYLTPELLAHVDAGALGLTIGATLSYISSNNQTTLEQYCFRAHKVHISQDIADALRFADEGGTEFSEETLPMIMQITVKSKSKMKVSEKVLRRYFPLSTSKKAVEKTVDAALKQYFAQGGTVCE